MAVRLLGRDRRARQDNEDRVVARKIRIWRARRANRVQEQYFVTIPPKWVKEKFSHNRIVILEKREEGILIRPV